MGELEACYRHPDRRTGLHCTRCGNPTCPDCMIPAPVGHHCPACVAAARKDMRKVRTVTWGRRPAVGVVVAGLLVANVVIHVLVQQDPALLSRFGNQRAAIGAGEYYRLLTTAFVHVSWTHLAVNCFSLAYLGTLVEGVLGRARFITLYLLCALGGSVATLVAGPPSSAGASGAVFGVTGAAWIVLRRRGLDTGPLVGLIAVNLLVSYAFPQINWVAHVGGLVTGIVIAGGFGWAEYRSRPRLREAGTALATGLVLIALVPAGVRASPKYAFGYAEIMQRQREQFRQYGGPADTFLAYPPLALPQYQAVKNGAAASYDAYVYEDPARARTLTIEFGDGSTAEASVPAGSAVRKVRFVHRFPPDRARYEQRLTLDGDSFAAQAITDVCPGGTTKMNPEADGGEDALCMR
jgi:membrane associated rhomboid family serine protease